MRSIIDVLDLSVKELDELIRQAVDISERPRDFADAARGKTVETGVTGSNPVVPTNQFGEVAEWFMAAVLLVRVPSQECEE